MRATRAVTAASGAALILGLGAGSAPASQAQTCGPGPLDDGGFSWTNCANEATEITYDFTADGQRLRRISCVDPRTSKFYSNPHTVNFQQRRDPVFVSSVHPAPARELNQNGSCLFF